MLAYPARAVPTDSGLVVVRVPDVPQVAAVGKTEDEALRAAQPILAAVLCALRDEHAPLPRPSDVCGAPMVEVAGFGAADLELMPETGQI